MLKTAAHSLWLLLLWMFVGCDLPTEETSRTVPVKWPPRGAASADSGWPRLLGPSRDGVSAESNLRTDWPDSGPPLLWEKAVGQGYSSPVAVGDSLVLLHRLGDEEHVQCLDAATGEENWDFAYPTTYRCPHRHYSEGPYCTPLIEDGRVYAIGAQGQMHCLSLADGSLIWRRMLHQDFAVPPGDYPVAAGPCIDGDVIVLNLGGADTESGIIGLDKLSGETLWAATDEPASCATPAAATIHGQRHVFVFSNRALLSVDPETGDVRWRVEHFCRAPDSMNATSPLVQGDLVLVVCGPGPGAICLRILPDGDYEEVWSDRKALDSQFNSLICVEGYVYGFTAKMQGGSLLRCVELETGDVRWEHASELARGQGLAADGKLILWGEQGHLAALDVDPLQPVVRAFTAQPLLSAPCYSSPALNRGLLYVRNEGRLLCLDLR